MAKKYGNKSVESLSKRARSSVGRAPQWHHAASKKSSSTQSPIQFSSAAEVIEIPEGWEPITAMRMVKGKPSIFRVLLRKPLKRLENDLKARRARKSA